MRAKRFRPGQQYRWFTIYRKQAQTDDKGRTTYHKVGEAVGMFYGAIASASQREITQWQQNGHPITHKIVIDGYYQAVQPTDIVLYDNRRFYVQSVKHNGMMSLFTVLFCREQEGQGE